MYSSPSENSNQAYEKIGTIIKRREKKKAQKNMADIVVDGLGLGLLWIESPRLFILSARNV